MAVVDELAGAGARRGEAEPVNDVVETALAKREHDVARDALLGLGALEEQAELLLAHSIDGLGLLLLAQLDAVFGHFLAALVDAMLPRRVLTPVEHLVGAEHRLAETARNLRPRTCITTHD